MNTTYQPGDKVRLRGGPRKWSVVSSARGYTVITNGTTFSRITKRVLTRDLRPFDQGA